MLSVAEAQEQVLKGAVPLPSEQVPVLDALGRVAAEDVVSDIDIAPFDNSARDGYAVRSADTLGATTDAPVTLTVLEHIPAGRMPSRQVGPGEASRIMTGAPLPAGADAIVMVEDARGGEAGGAETVDVFAPVAGGEHVRRKGEDVRRGGVVVAAGEMFGPAGVGLAASVGRSMVAVYRRPRVGIVSTGDELVGIDETPGLGQIRNSNSYSIAASVIQAGAEAVMLGIARDTEAETRALIGRAAEFDVMLTTGGVSMGDYDVVRTVLEELGELSYWKIAMRPGAPNAFGTIAGTPFFGLPGNPTSAMVGFELYVRPLLRKMAGHTRLLRPTVNAVLEHDISTDPTRHFFLRGHLGQAADGSYRVALAGSQTSALLTTLHRSNCLLSLPAGPGVFAAGEVVSCIWLDVED